MELKKAIDEFLMAMEADGLSRSTLRWYTSLLKKFSEWAGEIELEQIDAKRLREFLVYVRSEFSAHTMSGQNRTLHRFFKWCAIEYDLPKNPMKNIKYIQPPAPTELRAAAVEDVVKLFDAIESGIIGHRDRAILAFIVDTGARLGGVATLTMNRLNIEQSRAIVNEKGDQLRVVYFSKFTARLLKKWVSVRADDGNDVFYNLGTGRGLTPSGVQQIFRRLKAKAGVNGRAHPHAFRHTFSKEYLKKGGDIATLSRLLGHADIKLTMKFYLWFVVNETAEEHKKFPTTDFILDRGAGEE
jgi:integrase/recombinase XerD